MCSLLLENVIVCSYEKLHFHFILLFAKVNIFEFILVVRRSCSWILLLEQSLCIRLQLSVTANSFKHLYKVTIPARNRYIAISIYFIIFSLFFIWCYTILRWVIVLRLGYLNVATYEILRKSFANSSSSNTFSNQAPGCADFFSQFSRFIYESVILIVRTFHLCICL